MAIGEDKERIYVTVSCDMANRIDFYRQKMGLSRSAFCSYIVGQGVMTMDRTMGLWDDMGKAIIAKTVEAVEDVSDNVELKGLNAAELGGQLSLDPVKA